VRTLIDDDEIPDKSKVQYEHMKRIRAQMAAEEEALKRSRIIKGVDKKKYKDIKYRHRKEEVPDHIKLSIMRRNQFLIGFMGLFGVVVIFLGINYPVLYLPISADTVIEIDLIFIGCTLAIAGVAGIIGFQHKHDKISDRIFAEHRAEIRARRI